jgi:ABC-type branched-subunit amino acid transport system ATPase component
MAEPKSNLELLASTVQVLSVVAGVVISVLSFNATRVKEAEARALEADKPFVELRRSTYLEAVKTAAIIANPEGRSPDDLSKAKRRFRELYVAELTMVEDLEVAQKMVNLAKAVDPELEKLTQGQNAALELARALKSGYTNPHAK